MNFPSNNNIFLLYILSALLIILLCAVIWHRKASLQRSRRLLEEIEKQHTSHSRRGVAVSSEEEGRVYPFNFSSTTTDYLEKGFNENLPDTVTALDIDTTRFMEYIYAVRATKGLDTGAYVSNILNSDTVKIEWFQELFKKFNLTRQFKSSIVWRAIVDNEQYPDVPELVISVTRYNPSEPYSIVIVGNVDVCAEYEKYFIDTFTPPNLKCVSMITGVTKENALRVTEKIIQEETSDIGYDEFYPFIEGGIDKLVKDYEAAKESVLILIGTYGTGKSTLIRTIMLKTIFKHFGICNSAMALKHPEIVGWISDFGESTMVSLEDADNFIASRESGNDQMSALLNAADGILQRDSKIIISTNLASIKNIDPALIRPGRTFRVIQFRKLTIEEANKAREKVGLPALEHEGLPSEFTLSEALNHEHHNNVILAPKHNFGFGHS